MKKYEVGQVIDQFRNHQEGVYFDIDDGGAMMTVFFRNPTGEEIDQFKAGKNFEIRFIELYGIVIITVKIGNLNWMDAPYSPHLSKNFSGSQIPAAGQGLALNLILIDAVTGEVKSIRLLGLSERFTRRLISTVLDEKEKDFNKEEYDKTIDRIFSSYQTNQIMKLSKDYCKIND